MFWDRDNEIDIESDLSNTIGRVWDDLRVESQSLFELN
jgi:hypothetical protein